MGLTIFMMRCEIRPFTVSTYSISYGFLQKNLCQFRQQSWELLYRCPDYKLIFLTIALPIYLNEIFVFTVSNKTPAMPVLAVTLKFTLIVPATLFLQLQCSVAFFYEPNNHSFFWLVAFHGLLGLQGSD